MTWRTSLFLVLLQLAIGVHLLYEGVWKVKNPAWSSEGYLRGATGPLALPTRELAGDPEVAWQENHFVSVDGTDDLVARFTVQATNNQRPSARFPAPLEKKWNAYFEAFVKHYKLDQPDETPAEPAKGVPPEFLAVLGASPNAGCPGAMPWAAVYFSQVINPGNPFDRRLQKILAEMTFLNAKHETLKWLTEGTKKKAPAHFTGEVPMTTPQRVQEYLKKRQEIRDRESQETTFGPKAAKLTKAQGEAKTLKKELLDDLDEQTAKMKKALREVLTYEQKRVAPLAETVNPVAVWSRLAWVDNTVRWGLVVVGAGLILGLLTRLACVGGVLLLLLFYLTVPPWPWLAENPSIKGHYLFVNENIIEILALMVIATSRPGSRYGLDAWLPFPRRSRGSAVAGARPARYRDLDDRDILDG
jgi:uncharacterized membrane protein YphA (DoxX/SURF4 family)